MPNREQLLTEHRTERDKERQRAITQGGVIAALPDGLEVRKAYTSLAHLNGRSAMQGVYEFELETYAGLLRLFRALPPCKTVRVVMFGEKGRRTTSFYPEARVPEAWREEHEITWVEGYFWEARPAQGNEARITVEWYTEPRTGLFVLCRAIVKCHGAHYWRPDRGGPIGSILYKMVAAPSGEARRVGSTDHQPSVTVYWYEGSFADAGQFVEHLIGGPTQNV